MDTLAMLVRLLFKGIVKGNVMNELPTKITVTRKVDLISLVNFTKIVAQYHSMSNGEAFDFIYPIITKRSEDIKFFNTYTNTLPVQIIDDEILINVWNTNWWVFKYNEEKDIFVKTVDDRPKVPVSEIAILKTAASKLLDVPLELMNNALPEVLNNISVPVRNIDLIDFFSLTEIISNHHDMTSCEAFDWIWNKILNDPQGKPIKIYNSKESLPKVVEEVCLAMEDGNWNRSILNDILDSHFWLGSVDIERAKEFVPRTKDMMLGEAAILKSDAVYLFNVPLSFVSIVDLRDSNNLSKKPIITLNENAANYSTKWLNIQEAAIAQFFNPRRNPDAKKEAVIEWINLQAVSAGLGESNNTASTIFTIIKPENHDPKKKRVEPQ
jgi:hypothetical protein